MEPPSTPFSKRGAVSANRLHLDRASNLPICVYVPSAQRFPRRVPDPNRGVVRKAFEKLLCLVGHDSYAHPFERRRWD